MHPARRIVVANAMQWYFFSEDVVAFHHGLAIGLMKKTPAETLLILKAFYLGHEIANNQHRSAAVAMIDAAIAHLERIEDDQSKVRLLFYLLLKAETLRREGDVSPIRRRAKEVASSLAPEIYERFMAIEDATQTRKRAYGLERGYIADKGIKTRESFTIGSNQFVISYDIACSALGIDEKELSKKDLGFLHRTSLKAMLKSHKIPMP